MTWGSCDICGEECSISRCVKHDNCDDCGKSRKECEFLKNNLVFRTTGLVCNSCHKKRMDKKIEEFSGDTDYTSEIICPHCGYEYDCSNEYADDNGKYIDCSECDNTFELGVHFQIDFSTEKVAKRRKNA